MALYRQGRKEWFVPSVAAQKSAAFCGSGVESDQTNPIKLLRSRLSIWDVSLIDESVNVLNQVEILISRLSSTFLIARWPLDT
jgi:hypothetical protein